MSLLDVEPPLFSFGVISDTQYVNKDDGSNWDGSIVRRYRQSLQILGQAHSEFQTLQRNPDLNFKCAVLLGDVVDGQAKGDPHSCVADVMRVVKINNGLHNDIVSESSSSSSNLLPAASVSIENCETSATSMSPLSLDVPSSSAVPISSSSVVQIDALHSSSNSFDWHFCMGNHDLVAMTRADCFNYFISDLHKTQCSPERMYYDFSPHSGYRFIVLDPFEIRLAFLISDRFSLTTFLTLSSCSQL